MTEIKYRPNLLVADDFHRESLDHLTTQHVMDSWFVKYEAWAYEEELRMLVELPKPEAALHFTSFAPHLKLAEVIAGHDSKVTRAEVADALAGLDDVRAFKARLAFKSFRVRENEEPSMWR